jgi:hypothetical protein
MKAVTIPQWVSKVVVDFDRKEIIGTRDKMIWMEESMNYLKIPKNKQWTTTTYYRRGCDDYEDEIRIEFGRYRVQKDVFWFKFIKTKFGIVFTDPVDIFRAVYDEYSGWGDGENIPPLLLHTYQGIAKHIKDELIKQSNSFETKEDIFNANLKELKLTYSDFRQPLNNEHLEHCPISCEPIFIKHVTTCGHIFEKEMIEEVQRMNHTCPLCRAPI